MPVEHPTSLLSIERRGQYGEISAWSVTCALATIIIGCTSSMALAQEKAAVELHATDGSAVVKGELSEVSDGSYVVETALGTFRIGLDEAECRGDACPALDGVPTLNGADADFSIQAATDAVSSLTVALLSGYAEDLGADYRINDAEDGNRVVEFLNDGSGERLASVDLRTAAGPKTNPATSNGVQSDLYLFPELDPLGIVGGEDELLIALNGAAIIAHPDNPINALSKQAIAELFSCSATRIKGLNGPLRLYAPNISSKAFGAFKAAVLDTLGFELCNTAIQLNSDAEIAEAVVNDPNALGVVGLDHESDAKPLAVDECGIIYAPTFFNVKTGNYPLTQRILLDAPPLGESSAAAQRFIDFALGDDGQKRLEETGFVGLTLDSTRTDPTSYLSSRLDAAIKSVQNTKLVYQLVEETENAIQLSTTFYFNSETSNVEEKYTLDNRAQRDLSRLARSIKANVQSGAELLVFGFADASGDYDSNFALSTQRAQSVADKLAVFDIPISVVAGFGEESPIACNSNPAGRAKNRRVEVWLRAPEEQASSF